VRLRLGGSQFKTSLGKQFVRHPVSKITREKMDCKHPIKKKKERKKDAGHRWLTPVILATQKAETSPGKVVRETLS
jgi:hypothetical protein